MRRLWLFGCIGLVTSIVAPVVPSERLAAVTTETVDIGMPFTGKWGYNAVVNPPYSSATSSHPSVHVPSGPGFQWATDLYAAAGTDVTLQVGSPSGVVTFFWTVLANGACGQRTQVNVRVDGIYVGSLYYEHLDNAVKSGTITNGMKLGEVHTGACNAGPHLHVEFKSDTGNYSCYFPYVTNNINVPIGTRLAKLGKTNATGINPPHACTVPGATLWLKRYNGPTSGRDYAQAEAVSPDGTKVFVTGSSDGAGPGAVPDYVTIAYGTSTGATLWSKRYNGPANGSESPYAVAVSPDGSKVFVTGSSESASSNSDYATIAYSASTGATLWTKRYNGTANLHDFARGMDVSPDGSKVFVTGYSFSRGGSRFDYATIAYSTSTGTTLWTTRYNGPASSDDYARDLAVSPDGTKVVVTGHAWGGESMWDYATIAYNASSGATLWTKRYNGPGSGVDYPRDLAMSPDGTKVFVTGSSYGVAPDFDYATIAYNTSTGATLWSKRYNGPAGVDQVLSLAASPDGSKVFVTGYSYAVPDADYATIAYSAI